jgi:hypothetical protein
MGYWLTYMEIIISKAVLRNLKFMNKVEVPVNTLNDSYGQLQNFTQVLELLATCITTLNGYA